jgi:hypothetical protein
MDLDAVRIAIGSSDLVAGPVTREIVAQLQETADAFLKGRFHSQADRGPRRCLAACRLTGGALSRCGDQRGGGGDEAIGGERLEIDMRCASARA